MSLTQYDPFKEEVTKNLLKVFADVEITDLSFDSIYSALELPPDFSFGQAAFPCYMLAKKLRKSPLHISKQVSDSFNKQKCLYVELSESNGPYVNFHCNCISILELGQKYSFEKNALSPQNHEKVIVEYSQPNTHKTLHVGHLRCLVLGDALCNILEYVGHEVIRATYPGDIGTHVAKIIWYLTHPSLKQLPLENKAQWLGTMYAQADAELKSKVGTSDEKEIKQSIAQVLKEISEKHGSYYELWKMTREWSLDYLKEIYQWLECRFDVWFFESEFDQPSIDYVLEKFKEGLFIKDNGAIGIDLSSYNLGFVMYLKSDGNGLYITKDLLLLMKKLADPTITRSVYVVDSRQKRHFEQLFKTAEMIGHPRAADSYHLSYETVNAETGEPFSSRALKGMEISELRSQMEEKIKTDYLSRYQNTWNVEDIQKTAETVCVGALKYGLLNTDNNTQIRFSLDSWLKLDGDTGPYLQYVHARCCSILRKVDAEAFSKFQFLITEEIEKEIIYFLHRFSEVCLQAAFHFKPSIIANYLYDLARLFNRFYEACPIIKSDSSQKNTRITIVKQTQKIISSGLNLLGIQSPKKM